MDTVIALAFAIPVLVFAGWFGWEMGILNGKHHPKTWRHK